MKYIFSYCLLLFTLAGISQEIEFSHLSIENGLSQNSVLSITQDSNGFLWFGTRNGLNKYDSYRFTVYKNSPLKKGSISDNYITALLCDKQNTIWAGTHQGLNRYDADSDSFTRISLATGTSSDEVNKSINCIYQDRRGQIWIGTDFTVKILNRAGAKIKVSTVPLFKKKLIVRCIYQDRENVFWIGTSNGVIRLRDGKNGFVLLDTLQNKESKGGLSSNHVTSIVEDTQGNIWVGTSAGGLNLYNRLSGSFIHFIHNNANEGSLINNNIRKLLTDTKGNLWIGTQDGLSILDIKTKTFRNYRNDPWDRLSLSQNSIHSFYRDRTGTIWIGTFFGGVNSFFSYKTAFKLYNNRSPRNRLNNNVISSIIEDDHSNLWVGTEGGGVNYLDMSTGRVVYYTHNPDDTLSLGSNLVKIIYKDKDKNIWIGTHGGGLNLLNKDRKTFRRFMYENNETLGSEITCMLEDSRGVFWVGTETAGIRTFKKSGTDIIPVNIVPVNRMTKNAAILSILETTGNNIWLGTVRGLYIIGKDKISVAGRQSGDVSAVKANCLFEDARGDVWVGVNNNGLRKYSKQGKLIHAYSEADGLSDNNVVGILQDDRNTLWISTGNGLCRFNISNNTFTSYTEADGLEGNIFNHNSYYKSKGGAMFFGGYNGFISFFPENIEINQAPPPVYITKLKFNDDKGLTDEEERRLKSETAGREVKLRYDQNLFTIDFAALNYIKASKNTYKYLLKGYDKGWNTTGVPSAVYSNVPPGNYQFIVQGSNNDNIWGKPATLNIVISPPFWKTWWAYTLYVLLVAGLIFLISRYFFLRALYKKNQELTQLKLNFFTNISHEIRTHLSLIIGPVDKLITGKKQAPEDNQQLVTIKNNSESLLQLVNELMDFRKAETGHLSLRILSMNIVPFIESIYASFHSLSASRHIQTDFISSSDDIKLYFDPEQLKKVFYNLLSNAYKFTPDGSYISVRIEERSSGAYISVINKGKAISRENMGKLFDNYFQEDDYGKNNTGYGIGLALSKSIVELHGGELTVTSESEPNYTCFTVRLQKGRGHFSESQIIEEEAEPAEQADAGMAEASNESPAGYQALGIKHTLLLVEDNKAIRGFIKEALQGRYKIIESTNGLEGWLAAADQIPDLIISDVMMPEMDGLELCRRVKSDERTSHIPVILLTARNAVASQISGLQTGADIYLTKPFSVEILSLHIFNLLKAREALWKQFDRQIKPDLPRVDLQPETTHLSIHPLDEAFINKMIRMVEEKLDDPEFGIAMLSKMAAMSQPVLFKKIKAITGLSANEFVKSLRLKKAAGLLRENKYTVYEISYIVGYDSSKYFSREFKKYYHMTPSEYASKTPL
ncbi:two component regulator with propeller domain [Arcticibacter tournemirensis]|uniref:histidine kinase n=1 Tax=Arcticibacter tournemirensis TaxID=699437 RepID=A0A5M9GZG9_9SPHI|nr:hybrid sensor histidine kinase/response regulator transcription factor [Arcticibacter tournemirensis]KAA8479171.1 response regulator [Arcticibacter tournemirensis]TQM48476.1 two component regulator with propeller domain [Arcticibacter tournemirensis]